MKVLEKPRVVRRFEVVAKEKAGGATYTPCLLADFVAKRITEAAGDLLERQTLRILDPAVGDGALLLSLMHSLMAYPNITIEAYGFDTNLNAIKLAESRIRQEFPGIFLHLQQKSFIDHIVEKSDIFYCGTTGFLEVFDLIIANPPYVRTQIIGASEAQRLAKQFGLSGRVDLYSAFVLGMAQVLKPGGIAGIIVSNRFMTTKAGAPVRQAILERFNLRHVWDLGDTKLFDAAVLPAVLLAEGKNASKNGTPAFTSIYETTDIAEAMAADPVIVADPIAALDAEGVVQLNDGRFVDVHHGLLNTSGAIDGIWRVATDSAEEWLKTVSANTWGTFGEIGSIRVGVKTCADKVFIRSDWQDMPEKKRPELLKPLITHHIARRFKASTLHKVKQILYPHTVSHGLRHPVDLAQYPKSAAYLQEYRTVLEGRDYVIEAGRKWYEIWVPQDPNAWDKIKLVFRDITDEPTFWIDQEAAVVNGDCYWVMCKDETQVDLLWLAAAVGNSKFIERFYDYRFPNKLYAGRRRFITQYVEQFPLPDPNGVLGKSIINKAKEIYASIPSLKVENLQKELDAMIWHAFGLIEKVGR
ncbi:MAG TPA: N-6 DNA methylase [Chromatiaceae bacterium]|nr:N-6 DNA methylase [Chromatiaceae bacterium]